MIDVARPARLPVLRQIRDWAAALWLPGPNDAVMVSETSCSEPGRAPVATVVAWLKSDGECVRVAVPKPMDEVTQRDIYAACAASN